MIVFERTVVETGGFVMKLLTPEEIAKLKESPYVVETTERYVYFNIEFKAVPHN